jgi:nitroreductase
MVLENKDRIQKLSDLTVDYFEDNIARMAQKIKELEGANEDIPENLQPMFGMIDTLKRIVKAGQFGFEVIFHKAPAVMIFHAPTSTSTPKDDCVIASTTVVMAAMTMGLETCYIGLFEFAANTYQPIVEQLDLPLGHKVYSVLSLGRPQFKFLRTVDRKPMRVRWE